MLRQRIDTALLWDGDAEAAREAAAELAGPADSPPADDADVRHEQHLDLCAVEQRRLRHAETAAALRAARRRTIWTVGARLYLPTFFREQGRLAARLGRMDEAVQAYRNYLSLRREPEPALDDESTRCAGTCHDSWRQNGDVSAVKMPRHPLVGAGA